ncbi:hypothetical protein VTI28DRAFT_2854 [Corynascus sepedonium]
MSRLLDLQFDYLHYSVAPGRALQHTTQRTSTTGSFELACNGGYLDLQPRGNGGCTRNWARHGRAYHTML